jgi:hypothetical protein
VLIAVGSNGLDTKLCFVVELEVKNNFPITLLIDELLEETRLNNLEITRAKVGLLETLTLSCLATFRMIEVVFEAVVVRSKITVLMPTNKALLEAEVESVLPTFLIILPTFEALVFNAFATLRMIEDVFEPDVNKALLIVRTSEEDEEDEVSSNKS